VRPRHRRRRRPRRSPPRRPPRRRSSPTRRMGHRRSTPWSPTASSGRPYDPRACGSGSSPARARTPCPSSRRALPTASRRRSATRWSPRDASRRPTSCTSRATARATGC
jgi:hypothetical protein